MPRKKKKTAKTVETIKHTDAHCKNIPISEYQLILRETEIGTRPVKKTIRKKYIMNPNYLN